MRALEGIVYSTYSGSRFVLAGTPSGISLSREGGAHQSLSTPGHRDRDAGARRTPSRATRASSSGCCSTRSRGCRRPTARRSTSGSRRRRSTRPVRRSGRARSARSGCARTSSPAASGCASPAPARTACCSPRAARSCPEALAAATLLAAEEGVEATVLCLSSPDRLYRDWQATPRLRRSTVDRRRASHLERLLDAARSGVFRS